jgi:2-polyprenyl-3-methyl-5-hydroxy-6-metoxy-1,4-benzoquinol methylase
VLRRPEAPDPTCALCGAVSGRPLFLKEDIPYYRCPACTFVYSRPAVNANFANEIDDYEPAYLQYLEGSPDDAVNDVALLAWAERFRPLRGERALDVGAGSGRFVRHLRGRGVEAQGLEPALPIYARFLASEPWFSSQTLEQLAHGTDARFAAVFACDVLEHVAEPEPFVAAASELLAPDGVLIVSTPDVASVLARLTRRHWHYFNKYHLSYFSRATLGGLMARAGLREAGFARLPRSKSLGYLIRYARDFALRGRGHPNVPDRLDDLRVSVNLFDTMYVAFQRA